jgi:hypothetical protein
MTRFALLAAATFGAGLLAAVPAAAQPQLQIGIGPDGRPQVGIRDPERERWERREYWRQRREDDRARAYEEGRRDALRAQRYGLYGVSSGAHCRTVTVQEEDDWGRTITKRFRRCS